jgi:hypothetical protein
LQHDPGLKNAVPGAGAEGRTGAGPGAPIIGAGGGQHSGAALVAGGCLSQQPCRQLAQPFRLRTATADTVTTIRR